MSRALVRTLLTGGEATLAVPLALAPAARIQERDWEVFLTDSTQLTNGLRDLVEAVGLDGVAVCSDDVLLAELGGTGTPGPHGAAACEATARLRGSYGDRLALVAVLPGPTRIASVTGLAPAAAGAAVQALGQSFLKAGADVVVVRGEGTSSGSLSTLANIARFHQAIVVGVGGSPTEFAPAAEVPLDAPVATAGITLTSEHVGDDVDFTLIEDWVDGVRG